MESIGLDVANERGQEHRLGRTIDATFGGRENVHRTRRRPALDTTVGEVEGGLAHIEEGVVAIGFGNQELRRTAAFATAEAGGEIGTAVRIGHRFAEHFVVARDELDRRIGDRLGRGQRTDEGMAIVARGLAP